MLLAAWRHALLVGCCLLLAFPGWSPALQSSQKQHILVLHSYHEGLTWTDGENHGIRKEFASQPEIELCIEYLDSKRIPYEDIGGPFAEFLANKYRHTRFEAVIVSDNNALDFVAEYERRLFPGTPVVFCGINNFSPNMLTPFHGKITGVVQTLDPGGTISLIERLQPDLRTLAVVSGTTPTARAIRDKVNTALLDHPHPFGVQWLDGLDAPTLLENLGSLSEQDAVLLCNFNRDADGHYFSHEESARMISEASAAPVYAMEDHYLGTGVTGGYMNASEDQGQVAAELSLSILQNGEIPPIHMECPNRVMFDHAGLERFGLDASLLPPGATVINVPSSFFTDHRHLIWNLTIAFSFLVIALVAVAKGLHRSRQAERKLRASEENLRTTLDSIGDAVIATDAKGRVIRMNPVAQHLTGWDLTTAEGKALSEVLHIIDFETGERLPDPVEVVLRDEEPMELHRNALLLSRDGSKFRIADSAAPIRSRRNVIQGVVLVFRDISEEHALQEQLRQAQKLEAIGQLAGGVAHDFNNMLGGILGAAELLAMEVELSPEAQKYHGIIMDSVRKAGDLTAKLLTFARKQHPASTPVDVHGVVREAVALLESSVDRRIGYRLQLDAEASHVVGDPTQLQSAIMNLAINASHAMPNGGEISFSSRTVELDETYCNNTLFDIQPGSFLDLEIRDNGDGIPPEHLPHIFEPFFTTKEPGKGTGLGLSAVFGTVQQHHGAINVYSELNRGTSFHLYLPLTEDRAAQRSPRVEPQHGSGNILLVDDEALMQAVGRAMLEKLGYTVETADNGAIALERYKAQPDHYDLVLLDMIMPIMSGKDCFDQLKELNPDVRVVLSSGFAQDKDVTEMKRKGLKNFIGKPFLQHELSQVVYDALKS